MTGLAVLKGLAVLESTLPSFVCPTKHRTKNYDGFDGFGGFGG